MKLNMVGFFRELKHGDDEASSLIESVRDNNLENEDAIIEYLKNGTVLHISLGVVQDVLDPSRKSILDSLYTLTDGVWCWPSDLTHYVKTYHVDLPKEFVDYMAYHNWQTPTDIDIEKLEDITPVFY